MNSSLVGTILHAHWGYGCTLNTFAVIVKETPKSVIVTELKTQIVSGDGTSGEQMPIMPSPEELAAMPRKGSFRATKYLEARADGRAVQKFSSVKRFLYFQAWDGQPKYFNSD